MRTIKKKIIFGITSLTFGGAERVLVDICNELKNEYDITIFSLYGNGGLEKQLDKDIKFESIYNKSFNELSKVEKILFSLRLMFFKKLIYKKYIKKDYDVEIAFLEGPITRLFSAKNSNVQKIAWVHNDIKLVFGQGIKAKIKSLIDKNVYDKYDKIVFVTKDNKKSFEDVYNLNNNKYVIYNYLNQDEVIRKSEQPIEKLSDNLNFVTVSRLVEQKAIDRLVKVHSKLIKDGYKHNFYIIGDGPMKNEIQELINSNNINNTFILLGQKENPYPYIKAADYFCLFSYFEGYPMVLEEAKTLNKFILITDTAARENLQNYSNSIIAENNESGIYDTIKNVLENNIRVNQNIKYKNDEILLKIKQLIEEK